MATVVPVAKALSRCDSLAAASAGKVDLHGLFNAIRPGAGYPHSHGRFTVFAQLVGGLGRVPFFVDIRDAESDALIWTTEIRELSFPDRTTVVQVALMIEGCRFGRAGLYLIELFCDNTWVCDAPRLLR